jgi:hypothetical protein
MHETHTISNLKQGAIMSALKNNNLPSNALVDFPVQRILSSTTPWVSSEFKKTCTNEITDEETKILFSNLFSFVIPDNALMANLELDPSETKTYQAERYGGVGVGDNGGGARVGNTEGFQIKGIGKNPLAGSAKVWHTYGSLNAIEAIYEAVYTHIVNTISPIGAAKIYGIIFTGPESAYYEYIEETHAHKKGWGALLVREACRRPAHFLRSPSYSPPKNSNLRVVPDVVRVRTINKEFLAECGNGNGYIKYVGKFLQNCADQFAFSRIARLAHSTLSNSNISIDGRWLDLAGTTFVRGGENSGILGSFYSEPEILLPILSEMMETFAKYNRLNFNIAPLVNYYMEQYTAYLGYHLSYLFALSYSHLSEDVKLTAYQTIVTQSNIVIGSAKTITAGFPSKADPNDPVVVLIEGLFLSLGNNTLATQKMTFLKQINGFDAELSKNAFSMVMRDVYQNANALGPFLNFAVCAAITSMRRTLVSEYFFKNRFDAHTRLMLDANDTDQFSNLIETSTDICDWAFPATDDQRWLYRDKHKSIFYNGQDATYYFVDKNNKAASKNAHELLDAISTSPTGYFIINGFDFKPYLARTLSLLTVLENGIHD